jgi:hypothetical protein
MRGASKNAPFLSFFFGLSSKTMENRLFKLELLAPLVYVEDRSLQAFAPGAETGTAAGTDTDAGETLFLFELDPAQGLSIEPDPEHFLGPLVFSGRLPAGPPGAGAEGPPRELPAGRYLFAQQRRHLNREECIHMAVELQKDGLWERLRPEPYLYLRFLIEDGRRVSQAFRPYGDGKEPEQRPDEAPDL